MRQKEGQLDDKIKKYCDDNNLFYMKTIGKGYPDCIICVNSYFVSFETKVDDNTLSELQKYHIQKIKNAKGVSEEIRDYDTAIKILKTYQNKVI